MRSASFQNEFNKVFSRSKSVIARKHFKILDEDQVKGIIRAERPSKLIKPSYIMDIEIIKNDEVSTKVTVKVHSKSRWLKPKQATLEMMEGRFISMLSGNL